MRPLAALLYLLVLAVVVAAPLVAYGTWVMYRGRWARKHGGIWYE